MQAAVVVAVLILQSLPYSCRRPPDSSSPIYLSRVAAASTGGGTGCQTQASDSPVLPPAPAASAGAARVWRLPGRLWHARPRRDRRTPLLSAAAGSVSPASPYSPPPIARCSAAPLRPSRAARRRDGCRGGDCVIVCVCIVCGATRAMRATRARGASTEPVECRKCSRHHRSDLADAVVHEHEHAGHRWKHRDEHDKLHQSLVDVLNVPSRAQHASAGTPIGHHGCMKVHCIGPIRRRSSCNCHRPSSSMSKHVLEHA